MHYLLKKEILCCLVLLTTLMRAGDKFPEGQGVVSITHSPKGQDVSKDEDQIGPEEASLMRPSIQPEQANQTCLCRSRLARYCSPVGCLLFFGSNLVIAMNTFFVLSMRADQKGSNSTIP